MEKEFEEMKSKNYGQRLTGEGLVFQNRCPFSGEFKSVGWPLRAVQEKSFISLALLSLVASKHFLRIGE
jgi:hypothetical protein